MNHVLVVTLFNIEHNHRFYYIRLARPIPQFHFKSSDVTLLVAVKLKAVSVTNEPIQLDTLNRYTSKRNQNRVSFKPYRRSITIH